MKQYQVEYTVTPEGMRPLVIAVQPVAAVDRQAAGLIALGVVSSLGKYSYLGPQDEWLVKLPVEYRMRELETVDPREPDYERVQELTNALKQLDNHRALLEDLLKAAMNGDR